MTEKHDFTPIDVGSQICKVCSDGPRGRLHRTAPKADVKPAEKSPTRTPDVFGEIKEK